MRYRRTYIRGGKFFFTVVTDGRQKIFSAPQNVELLRSAFRLVMRNHPFAIDAAVVLPDHIHCIWTLPREDSDFSMRWRLIKSAFSRTWRVENGVKATESRRKKNERTIWQRRFWEHLIRDEDDFRRHVEYIHYNPVKHGLVKAPKDWAHSSFHRYVSKGILELNWGSGTAIEFEETVGKE